jgi:hypothetical protein
MKRQMVLLIVVVLLMTSLGCALFSGRETNGGGTASSGDFQITVVNESPDEVCYVLISNSESSDWGDDWLSGDETIAPGDSKTFTVSGGQHDVQLESCDEAVMATAWFIERSTTVTAGNARATARVFIDNTADTEVCFVFISPSTGDEWGDDLMGENETIMTGQTRVFYMRPDTYDMQVRDCNEEILAEQYEVDLSSDKTWTLYNE